MWRSCEGTHLERVLPLDDRAGLDGGLKGGVDAGRRNVRQTFLDRGSRQTLSGRSGPDDGDNALEDGEGWHGRVEGGMNREMRAFKELRRQN